MKIVVKDKFKEVSPREGYLLFLEGEVFEGICCPIDVNPEEIYFEITEEEAAALIIDEENNTDDTEGLEDVGNDNA